MINETHASQSKKTYETPTFTTWGTIADLTKAGKTHPGEDFMIYNDGTRGSVLNAGPK